jgi:hypothetical protein
MPDERMEGIPRRMNNAHDGEEYLTNRGLFKVITTAQLLKMRGVDMDTMKASTNRSSISTTIH